MNKHIIVASCAALAWSCLPAMAGAQARTPGTSSTSSATAPSKAGSQGSAAKTSRTDALAALQDARTTLARLTEGSMPQDARDSLARVSTEFRTMYKAYTGEEPTPQKSAAEAAKGTKAPDPGWQKSYDTLEASINRIVGTSGSHQAGTVGTSGSTAAGTTGKSSELTPQVRQEFEVLRQQLQRFHTMAGGQSTAASNVK